MDHEATWFSTPFSELGTPKKHKAQAHPGVKIEFQQRVEQLQVEEGGAWGQVCL